MPALDDHIDDLFDTYLYHIISPQKWQEIRTTGIEADLNGTIPVVTTNQTEIIDSVAVNDLGMDDFVIVKFNLCAVGANSIDDLEPDMAASPAVPYRRIVRRNIIGPSHLEKECRRTLDHT
jgi:hypothetical protein